MEFITYNRNFICTNLCHSDCYKIFVVFFCVQSLFILKWSVFFAIINQDFKILNNYYKNETQKYVYNNM